MPLDTSRDTDDRPEADVYEEIRRGFYGPRPARPKITRITSGHFEAAYHGTGSPPRRIDTPAPEPRVEINLATDPGLGPGNTVLPNPSPFARLLDATPSPWRAGARARDVDTVPTHERVELLSAWRLSGALVGLLVFVLACIAALAR